MRDCGGGYPRTLSGPRWGSSDDESRQLAVTREVERLQSAAQRDELPWEHVTIPVDGQPTPFQLCQVQDGWWVAAGRGPDADLTLDSRHVPLAGRGPDADLTLDSRHVPLAGLALVRVTGLPMPGTGAAP